MPVIDYDELEDWGNGKEEGDASAAIEKTVVKKPRKSFKWLLFLLLGLLSAGFVFFVAKNYGADSKIAADESESTVDEAASQNSGSVSDAGASPTDPNTVMPQPITYTANEFNYGEGPQDIDNTPIEALVADEATEWLVANQVDFEMKITGQVASEETKVTLEKTVDNFFGQSVVSEVTVDPDLEELPWVAKSPELIFLLPFKLADGTLGLGPEGIYVDGDVKTPEQVDEFIIDLENTSIPVIDNKVAVHEFHRPEINVSYADGILTMTGLMPSQRAVDRMEEAAVSVFGEENTNVDMRIDPDANVTYTTAIMDRILMVFKPLDDRPFKFGTRDKKFYTQVEGISFEVNSAELNERGETFLTRFAALTTPLDIVINLEGYTDSVGNDEDNQILSEQRAEAVSEYLVSQGLPPEKVAPAEGFGESSPQASNDTPEGRAKNRRVELRVES